MGNGKQLTLCPCDFIETKRRSSFMKRFADQISPFRRDVVVLCTTQHSKSLPTAITAHVVLNLLLPNICTRHPY